MKTLWYCQIDGTEYGPLTLDDIRRMAKQRKLIPSDLIRKGTVGNWFPAESLRNVQFSILTCPTCRRQVKGRAGPSSGKLRCEYCESLFLPTDASKTDSAKHLQPAGFDALKRPVAWAIAAAGILLLGVVILRFAGTNRSRESLPSQPYAGGSVSNVPSKGGYMDMTPDEAADQVMRHVTSTPQGRSEVERLGNKDLELSRFQVQYGISDRIAEAAIKEWVLTHNGNFDWDLEDVKTICLRNLRNGIPPRELSSQ